MRVIIHFNKKSKIRELSKTQVVTVLTALSFIFIGLIAAIINLYIQNSSTSLSVENKKLKTKIVELKSKIDEVQKSLSKIYESERKLQLAAGIDLNQSYATGGEEEFTISNVLSSKETDLKSLTKLTDNLINQVRFEQQKFSEIVEKLNEKSKLAQHIPAIVPMDGVFSDHGFGIRLHPILKRWRMHEGLDILGLYGTPIYASGAGVVKFVGWNGGLGLSVVIDHGFGYETTYGHLSKVNVREGQKVVRFQKIGECGSTGLSTGPHLHYEVSFNGEKQNPVYYFIK